ncbi:hypothetical protein ABZX77_23820 [Streptomyces sp. NPDC004237]|uniref:hypothetical protein n=1 Tax=Streptomyces sp. NPDC004237 TaxID=3154455 RepID=UPI00339E2E55
MVLWSIDTEDWKYPDSTKVADAVIDKARPGDVVLMHDIHPTSVAAVPRILSTLAARGYHFVTISELYASHPLKTGYAYGTLGAAYGR